MPEPTAREIENFPMVDAATFNRFPDAHVGHIRRIGGDGVTSPVWQYCTVCLVGVATQDAVGRIPEIGVVGGSRLPETPVSDVPAGQQASGQGFAQFLEGLRGAAAAGQPFHVRVAVDLECTHPRELYAALQEVLVKLAAELARRGEE